jgi:hypothetical protein
VYDFVGVFLALNPLADGTLIRMSLYIYIYSYLFIVTIFYELSLAHGKARCLTNPCCSFQLTAFRNLEAEQNIDMFNVNAYNERLSFVNNTSHHTIRYMHISSNTTTYEVVQPEDGQHLWPKHAVVLYI